jgi:hypothetical protein
MLDPWIIEEIKRRERRGRIEQPVIQIPVRPDPRDHDPGREPKKPRVDDDPPRGVEIIDLNGSGVPTTYAW